MAGKTTRQQNQDLKPNNKKRRLENELRTVHLIPEYNSYDPLHDENHPLLRSYNDGRCGILWTGM